MPIAPGREHRVLHIIQFREERAPHAIDRVFTSAVLAVFACPVGQRPDSVGTVLAHEQGGQAEEGLALLAEAFAVMDKNDEHFYEAELYRLKGELTLQQYNVQGATCKVANPRALIPPSQAEAEAEACFLKAIDIARLQQAKSLELRAVMSLSRLWKHQGKKEEAHRTLTEIYGWFTEGFDTKDLQEAKALLQELA